MVPESIKMKLYDAAKNGDIATLAELLQRDPNLVAEVLYARSRNVLHIAAMHGQESIVEMLKFHAQLARDLDSQNSTPLHIAAARGNVAVASRLLSMAPETLWWRDVHDMNPVHIASMCGNVLILTELLRLDHSPAMERVHRGQTVLHLCIKHRHKAAFDFLLPRLGELICAKDDDGETILHLAVRCNRLTLIKDLVERTQIDPQTQNSLGKTALQILIESKPDISRDHIQMLKPLKIPSTNKISKVFPNLSDTTMVVVVLIATMAFQAAISPPGGVWQEDTTSHKAGDAVMASSHPKLYKHFVRANNTAFVSSIITIFLITTRQPSGRIFFLLISLLAMWVSLASISVSYGASIMVVSPNTKTQSLVVLIIIVVVVSLGIIGFIFAYNIIREWYLRRTSDHHTALQRLETPADTLLSLVDVILRTSDRPY
ncbi:ankyrin repeat-containing protein ITN1-like [Salvia hispanica]|uniref:ankyrin repeat-containing protein ITN1-like n=1 Tax=Salvia hispanica TaxID=49212 RepID=UPI002008FF33|nr:ankyrin repeat-containing protein ITN1-like [Salvia hispanica]